MNRSQYLRAEVCIQWKSRDFPPVFFSQAKSSAYRQLSEAEGGRGGKKELNYFPANCLILSAPVEKKARVATLKEKEASTFDSCFSWEQLFLKKTLLGWAITRKSVDFYFKANSFRQGKSMFELSISEVHMIAPENNFLQIKICLR